MRCWSGHHHADVDTVMLCHQQEILDRLERLTRMTSAENDSIDTGFAKLESGQQQIETALVPLDTAETRELAFLQDLENQRGEGQLAPDQQARLNNLLARQQAVMTALSNETDRLNQAADQAGDGSTTPVSTDPGAPVVTDPGTPTDGDPGTPTDSEPSTPADSGTTMLTPDPGAPDRADPDGSHAQDLDGAHAGIPVSANPVTDVPMEGAPVGTEPTPHGDIDTTSAPQGDGERA